MYQSKLQLANSFKLKVVFSALLTLFLFQSEINAQVLKGIISDKRTKEPIPFASVKLDGTSKRATSNANGYFSLGTVAPGNYELVIKSFGYDSLRQVVIAAPEDNTLRKFALSPSAKEVVTTEIKGDAEKVARSKTSNVSFFQLSSKQIAKLPTVGGEADITQYLAVLPGVVSSGDQGSQLYFRGGTPIQNMTLMDNIIIYNPYHSIGLYSVFENEIIKTADVYTGGFNAEYGSRTSGVLDIKTQDGSVSQHKGLFSGGPFISRLNMSGPIWTKEDKASLTYVGSIRGSYLDRTAPTFYPYAKQQGQILPYSFMDYLGKVTVKAGAGSYASVTAFNFTDEAKLGVNSNFKWSSSGFGANFSVIPDGSNTIVSGFLSYSGYKIDITEAQSLPRSANINGFYGGLNFSSYNQEDELKYGIGVNGVSAGFIGKSPVRLPLELDENSTEIFGYIKYRMVRNNLIIEPGFRLQGYSSQGLVSPEPRIAAKYLVSKSIRLKTSAGIYSQNLFSTTSDRDVTNLFNGFAVSPATVFDGDSAKISRNLQFARHWVVGIETDLSDALTIDGEVYVKDFNQLININREKIKSQDPDYIAERGLAIGLDLLLKYRLPHTTFQVSYSLARNTRYYGTQVYAPIFDRRHNLNAIASHNFGKNKSWELNGRFSLGSGFPFTQTVGFFEQQKFPGGIDANPITGNGNLGIFYGGPDNYNRGRLPFYHRFDASVKKTWRMDKRFQYAFIAAATNIYNRENLFYIDRVTLTRINQLPILPTLTIQASW